MLRPRVVPREGLSGPLSAHSILLVNFIASFLGDVKPFVVPAVQSVLLLHLLVSRHCNKVLSGNPT